MDRVSAFHNFLVDYFAYVYDLKNYSRQLYWILVSVAPRIFFLKGTTLFKLILLLIFSSKEVTLTKNNQFNSWRHGNPPIFWVSTTSGNAIKLSGIVFSIYHLLPIHLYLIFEKSSSTNWIFNLQKSILKLIFAGYTGSKNPVWIRLIN